MKVVFGVEGTTPGKIGGVADDCLEEEEEEISGVDVASVELVLDAEPDEDEYENRFSVVASS